MKLKITGELQTINGFKAEEITDSFKKATILVVGSYSSYAVDFVNDDIDSIKEQLKNYKPGQQAQVEAYLNCKESKGRYWTSLRGKSINLNATTNSQQATNSEDLPF